MTAAVSFATRPATPDEIKATGQEPPSSGRFKFLTAAQLLAQPPVAWRVLRVIPARGLIVLWGVSGSGKSFVAIDLAGAIVRGLPWAGRRTRRGNVVYIAIEGQLQHRVKAYIRSADIDIVEIAGLHTLASGVNLLDDYEVNDLIAALRSLADTISGIDVVILDTLNRALPGGDENSSEDMGRAIASAKGIEEALGCGVILVHHGGKDQARGPRGHSSLKAAVDTEILVERDGDLRTVKVEKSRDGTDGETLLTFKLRVVDLGPAAAIDPEADADERITSCVVEPMIGDAPPPDARGKSKRVPKGTELALRALREAIDESGQQMPGTSAIPPGVRAVVGQSWRDRYNKIDSLIPDADDADAMKRAQATRKKQFDRARKALLDAGTVGAINGWHWLQ